MQHQFKVVWWVTLRTALSGLIVCRMLTLPSTVAIMVPLARGDPYSHNITIGVLISPRIMAVAIRTNHPGCDALAERFSLFADTLVTFRDGMKVWCKRVWRRVSSVSSPIDDLAAVSSGLFKLDAFMGCVTEDNCQINWNCILCFRQLWYIFTDSCDFGEWSDLVNCIFQKGWRSWGNIAEIMAIPCLMVAMIPGTEGLPSQGWCWHIQVNIGRWRLQHRTVTGSWTECNEFWSCPACLTAWRAMWRTMMQVCCYTHLSWWISRKGMLMLIFLGSRLGRRQMSWITGWIWGKGKLSEGCRDWISRRI